MPARFPIRFPGPPRGSPLEQIKELARRIESNAESAEQLSLVEDYIQSLEPQIGNGKLVVWRDTTLSKTWLVTRIGNVQYKVEMAVPPFAITTVTPEHDFRWPHIIGADQDFIPGGVNLGRGSNALVSGIEGYYEFGPTAGALTLRVMNGSADGAPANVTLAVAAGAPRYFADFTLAKTITGGTPGAAQGLFVRLNAGPGTLENLIWARVIYTVP
jgi:hypothetical protein